MAVTGRVGGSGVSRMWQDAVDAMPRRPALVLHGADDPYVGRDVAERITARLDAELEHRIGVVHPALHAGERRQLLLDGGALTKQRLRLRLIAPEVGRAGAVVQAREVALELRDVKDAPLAP